MDTKTGCNYTKTPGAVKFQNQVETEHSSFLSDFTSGSDCFDDPFPVLSEK